MNRLLKRQRIPLIVLLLVLAAQSRADAFLLITHGDEISHIGDVPADKKEIVRELVGKNADVGFKYSHFGVFWLEIWTWGGEFCLYNDSEYWSLNPEQTAAVLGVSNGDVSRPWRYTFPPGLIIVVVIAVLAGVGKFFAKPEADKIKELLKDPRYQQAMAIIQDHADKTGGEQSQDGSQDEKEDDGGFEDAVQYLVSQGIPHDEAVVNLATVINVVYASAGE